MKEITGPEKVRHSSDFCSWFSVLKTKFGFISWVDNVSNVCHSSERRGGTGWKPHRSRKSFVGPCFLQFMYFPSFLFDHIPFFFQQVYIAQIRRPTVPATPKQNGLVLTATEQVLTLVLEEREVQSVRKVFMIETRSIGGPTADLPPQWYRRIEKHPRAPPQGLIMGPRRQDDNIVH